MKIIIYINFILKIFYDLSIITVKNYYLIYSNVFEKVKSVIGDISLWYITVGPIDIIVPYLFQKG